MTHQEVQTDYYTAVTTLFEKLRTLNFFFKVRCNKPQHHINSLLFITVNNICTKLNR